MSGDASARSDRRPFTSAYVGLVGVGAGVALGLAYREFGRPPTLGLAAFCLIAVLSWWAGTAVVESEVFLSLSSIVLLAASAILGPLGAGLVGCLMALLQRERIRPRARLFNMAMTTVLGVAGGWTYLAAGGYLQTSNLRGVLDFAKYVGFPILLADIVQVLLNAILIAGVVRFDVGVPARTTFLRLIGATGGYYLGYGVIAFLLALLWRAGGLGPLAVFVVVPPLLAARWALRQHAEERTAHEGALDVLVAAVEAKVPQLEGHSARVGHLAAAMAEELGLSPNVVSEARVAGRLHDLGLLALGPGVRDQPLPSGIPSALPADYPLRSATLLRGVTFISGSLEAIARHREGGTDGVGVRSLSAQIVGVADDFDLLTRGGPGHGALSPEPAMVRLRESDEADRDRVVDALARALARPPKVGAP